MGSNPRISIPKLHQEMIEQIKKNMPELQNMKEEHIALMAQADGLKSLLIKVKNGDKNAAGGI